MDSRQQEYNSFRVDEIIAIPSSTRRQCLFGLFADALPLLVLLVARSAADKRCVSLNDQSAQRQIRVCVCVCGKSSVCR